MPTAVAGARRIADGVPGAELTVIDGAAHPPDLEQPDALHGLLERVGVW